MKAKRNIKQIGILCNGGRREVNKQKISEVRGDLALSVGSWPAIMCIVHQWWAWIHELSVSGGPVFMSCPSVASLYLCVVHRRWKKFQVLTGSGRRSCNYSRVLAVACDQSRILAVAM